MRGRKEESGGARSPSTFCIELRTLEGAHLNLRSVDKGQVQEDARLTQVVRTLATTVIAFSSSHIPASYLPSPSHALLHPLHQKHVCTISLTLPPPFPIFT